MKKYERITNVMKGLSDPAQLTLRKGGDIYESKLWRTEKKERG
jgi:hypothetical protein